MCVFNMQVVLDQWQKDFLEYRGHSVTCTGRRVGKTYIHAVKACKRMLEKPNTSIIVASLTEDQAVLIILFAMNYLEQNKETKKQIDNKSTKTNSKKITLKNGSSIMARPVGNTGNAIRGFCGDVLILDEVSRFNELILEAATPILLTTGGEIWMCSTPFGKQGFFWRAYQNKENRYRIFETNTEEVVHTRPISDSWTEEQRRKAIKFLEEEKREKTELQYGQEYLGLFLEDLRRFYDEAWINKVCTIDPTQQVSKNGEFYGGFDLARMGGDQFTAEILKKVTDNHIIQVDHFAQKQLLTTDNERLVANFTRKWNCKQSGIDAGAGTLGVSILDHLKQSPEYYDIQKKIIPMNNRQLSDRYEEGKQRLCNEDMHDNLRAMGERGILHLFNDEDIKNSLRSIQWELVKEEDAQSKVRIHGRDSHIVEGIKRAAQLANTKSKNFRIMYV